VCHLGAIQEFLYFPRKVKIFETAKAQRVFRIIRYVLLVALIIQLSIMGSKYWCQIDPFVNIFDFKSFFDYILSVKNYDMGLIIIITLLLYVTVSSMFIYRPFCRTMCPIGLVLGWITRIPGASVIGLEGACVSCKMCNSTCELDAITRDNKISSVIYNPDCNSCGKCLDSCVKDGLAFVRKGKNHATVVKCENNCKIENKK
jgi:polyferredoxin